MSYSASDAWQMEPSAISAPLVLRGYNENGRRIGATHPSAKHSDETVQRALELKDDGWGPKRIAEHLACNINTVKSWCSAHRRALPPRVWRKVKA
jgi:hypothetical protein